MRAEAQIPRERASSWPPTQLPRSGVPLRYSLAVTPDPANLGFSAEALISFKILKATDALVLNAVDLEISSAAILGGSGTRVPIRQIVLDAAKQMVTFRLSGPIKPGQWSVRIQYTGRIQTHPAGLFALDYETSAGRSRALFTQFEPADARRFLPSWDEPAFRTPFDLRVTIPATQTAVSNMPVREEQLHSNGTKTVAFASTPAMSTYLLFLGMGEFDRVVTSVSGTELGIVTRAGAASKASSALENARRLLPYYNDYFGTAYPLPKLDNIAAPGSGQFFNAMENWGAIFTFEDYLLVDPAITSESRRRQIFSSMAHEMAHQWAGNLVTMEWWNDLWLNEGFASWMANKATAHLNPDWNALLDRIRSREAAMALDSLRETHPIVQPIDSVDQISQSFDDITYGKAEAVIVMLEDFLGDIGWRKGVRDYLKSYRLRNTRSDDLWRQIERATNRPVAAIAHDFTRQPGVPLIKVMNVQCSENRTTAELEQEEFRSEHQDRPGSKWRVPVVAAVVGGGETRTLIQGRSTTITIPGCGPLLVNAGQAGYYRTLYEPKTLDQLKSNYARLNSVDQLGLLAESWSLGLTGYQPASTALDLVEAIPPGADPEVWKQAIRILHAIYGMVGRDPRAQALVTNYASAKLGPELNLVGWDGSVNDPGPNAIVRPELIEALGKLGDAKVVEEAQRRFNDQSRDPGAIDGPLKSAILAVVGANADEATWNRLHEEARKESTPLIRSQLYTLLASAKNEDLARRALTLALSEEPGSSRSRMFEEVAKTHPELAYEVAVQNRETVQAMVDTFSRDGFIPALASGSSDARFAQLVRDFADSHLTATTRRPADIAAATIEKNLRVRESHLPDISAWMLKRSARVTDRPEPSSKTSAKPLPWPHEADIPKVKGASVPLTPSGEPDITQYLMVRDLMFTVRYGAQFALAPDGKTIAYVSDLTGEPQLWSISAKGGWPTQLTFGSGIDWIHSSTDGAHILYGADRSGDEHESMSLISWDGKEERTVLRQSPAFRSFGAFSGDGKQIAYSSTERNGIDYDIYTADVATGQSRRICEGHGGFFVLAWERRGPLLVVREARGEGDGNLYLLDSRTGKLTSILKPIRAASYKNVEWVPDGTGFYLSTNQDTNYSRVAFYDVASAKLTTVAAADYDIGQVSLSGDGRYLAWTSIETGFNNLHVRDLQSSRDLAIPDLPKGTLQIQFAADAPVLCLTTNSARTATRVYTWDLADGSVSLAVPTQDGGLDLDRMIVPTPVAFKARDGVTLTGLFYLPAKSLDSDKPPVFLALHGGPTNHAFPSYQADLQYYLAKGIAVLDFNYRGSSGHGRNFASLNDGERKADEIGDIADAVGWLRSTGRVDADRVAVGGGSYGGYLTNLALGTYPKMFVAGVSIVGISNWVTALETASPFLKSSDRFEFGDITDPKVRAFFAALSPINNAAKIKTPLIVLHGANDVRDTVSESDEFVSAIRKAGGDVTYLRFPDEGHDFTKLANRAHAYRAIASFLEKQFTRERASQAQQHVEEINAP